MLQDEQYGSDSSDEDYQPGGESDVSEEEGDGEPEDAAPSSGGNAAGKPAKCGKRAKQTAKGPRKRRVLVLEGEEAMPPEKDAENELFKQEMAEEKQRKQQDEEKKKADDLFADFMKDVSKPRPPARPSGGGLGSLMSSTGTAASCKPAAKAVANKAAAAQLGKITVTKVFDFAGEAVTVTKDVDANSREAKQAAATGTTSSDPPPKMAAPARRGGMASVLSSLGKAPKMSVLEKSKLDWHSFKKDENIEEELEQFKRSKDSYLEKQEFLQRADLRQFELEKSVRDRHRTPR